MPEYTSIFLLLGIVIVILIAANAALLWFLRKSDKKIDQLLEKGKIKSFKDIFLAHKDRADNLEAKIKDAFKKIKNLEAHNEKSFQKIGIVRFNPFNSVGGNQSFVIALLDDKDSGFIISSLFAEEGSRVYSKMIVAGKSDHPLSEEELEAIKRATNHNG